MRKLSANYIFDGKGTFYKNGILVIDNEGFVIDLIDNNGQLKESESIEYYNGILTPGFVNAHCHIELSHLKDQIPQGKGIPAFIKEVVAQRISSDEKINDAIVAAIEELKQNGIVAVGDISNKETSLFHKLNSDVYFYTFLESFGLNDDTDNALIDTALGLYEKWKNKLDIAVVPHASYSCSPLLMGKVQIFQEKTGKVYSFHNQECRSENELFISKSGELHDSLKKMGMNIDNLENDGLNSIQTVAKYFPAENNKILVHNIYTTEEDIDFLNEGFNLDTFYFCFCPRSNMYIEKKLPNVKMFYEKGLQCVIGTDGYSSNTSLSVLEEIKTLSAQFENIPLHEMLKWLCFNGAKSLKIDNRYGSFDKGKKPGVNLLFNVDLQNMEFIPTTDVKVII